MIERKDPYQILQLLFLRLQKTSLKNPEDLELIANSITERNIYILYNILYLSCQVDELRSNAVKPLLAFKDWLEPRKENYPLIFRRASTLLYNLGYHSLDEPQPKISLAVLAKTIEDTSFSSVAESKANEAIPKLLVLQATIYRINVSIKLGDYSQATLLLQEAGKYYNEHFKTAPNFVTHLQLSPNHLYKQLILLQVIFPYS